MNNHHKLLKRQIKRHLGEDRDSDEALQSFYNAISDAYKASDKNRTLLERSLEISSEELTESSEEIRAMLDAIPETFFHINSKDQIISFKLTENFGDFGDFGEQREPYAGLALDSCFPSSVMTTLKPLFQQCRATQSDYIAEIDLTDISRKKHHFEIRILPLHEQDIMIVLSDVTLCKEAERQVKESASRLEQQNRVLSKITALIESGCTLATLFQNVTEEVCAALNTVRASIWFFSEDGKLLTCSLRYDNSTQIFDSKTVLPGNCLPHYFQALAKSRAIAIENIQEDERSLEIVSYGLFKEPNTRSSIDASIRSSGEQIGVLSIEHNGDTRIWTNDEQQFIASVADLITLMYERSQRDKTQKALIESENKFKVLAESSEAAIFTFTDHFLYFNNSMTSLCGYSPEQIYSMNLEFILGSEFVDTYKTIPTDELIAQFQKKNALALEELDIPSHMEIEISGGDGITRWVHTSVAPVTFNGKNTWLASAFDITERRLFEAKLRYRAYHDELTSLPNRTHFLEKLETCLSRRSRDKYYRFAVVLINVDRVKSVNDTLGHMTGDRFLLDFSRRLREIVRRGDTLARFGGDEFSFLIDNINGIDEAIEFAETIQKSIVQPFYVEGHELKTTVSIGIAYTDRRYEKSENILRDADIAMYKAKTNGDNSFEVFDAEMHEKTQKIVELEIALRKAVKDNQLHLLYQPIISLKTGRVHSFEALLRWKKNKTTHYSPAEFISIAEDSGFIVPLGNWTIETVSRQIGKWQEHGNAIPISVNLSPKQFGIDVPDLVQQVALNNNISPNLINIEIIEEAFSSDDHTKQRIEALSAMGCKLILDDFGKGHSSLNCLHNAPLFALKIEKSFIANIDEHEKNIEYVKAITQLAQTLNIKVVAEGVETIAQMHQLTAIGCDYAQGYLFSKPVTAKAAEKLIDKQWDLSSGTILKNNPSILRQFFS